MARIETLDRLRDLIPEAAPLVAAKIRDHLDDQAIAFIAGSPFLVMATAGDSGIELSPKGDEAGFVLVEDWRTLVIPERPGNRLALGLTNIINNNRVGLAILRPATWEMLRIIGRAELLDDSDLCERLSARGQPAILAIRVHVERAYFQCARSLRRSALWNPESWAEPMRVSFGKIIASATGRDELAPKIDEAVKRSADDL